MELMLATTDSDFNAARGLFREYHDWLGEDVCFQAFGAELAALQQDYWPPAGAMILMKETNEYIGCVGLRRIDSDRCEVKRLFVKPAFRNRGAGRALLDAAIGIAEEMRFRIAALHTLARLEAAIDLYRKSGFRQIRVDDGEVCLWSIDG